MKNKIFALVSALLIGAGFGVASPAQANIEIAATPHMIGPVPSIGTADCLNGYACGWTGQGATGSLYQWTSGYVWQQAGFPIGGSANNNFESLQNKSGSVIRYWDTAWCSGNNYWTMYPGQSDRTLGIYNNRISSIDTVPNRLGGTC